MQDIQFTAADFAGGSGSDFVITTEGVTLADDAVTAVYTSPIITTDFPFNVAVPQWLADMPEMTHLDLRLRTKTAGGDWSAWTDIHQDNDLTLPGDTEMTGDLIVVPAADITHQYLQFSISLGRYEGVAAPIMRQLTITIIDSTDGPTTAEMLIQQAALDAARFDSNQTTSGSAPRPTVISREVWCTDADCDYTDGLVYEPATHMVVHHTVSGNSSSDWAAIVRAIWNFHTYTRGWGDIGYNYLIDRTGVIYEGHMNEDYLNLDVIGTHASAANAGSMGVSLMGTFTSAEDNYPDPINPIIEVPPPVMQAAAVDLLAWKADQRNIDVFSASRLVNMNWGLPHLMGHRDVYGGTATTCPGGSAYALLPNLREQVAQRINFTSPHIYIDELSGAFTKSNNGWYEGPRGCGNSGHSYYTWNVTEAALGANWGEWRPDVAVNGRYQIEVYAPYCDTNGPETKGAVYTVTDLHGSQTITVSHSANIGEWMSLGEFDLAAGTGNLIRLTDLTVNDPTNYDYGVWFDAIRLRPLVASAVNTAPAANAWLNQAAVNFAWDVVNADSALTTTLQVATDAAFSNIVHTESWATAVSTATHTFSQNYTNLYWRILFDTAFNIQTISPATRFGLNSDPLASQVTAIFEIPAGGYLLQWQGNATSSSVAAYTVEYRAPGDTAWMQLANGTTAVSAIFTPPNPAQTYEFRSQATSEAGNVEVPHSGADLDTTQSTLLSHVIMLPIISK